MLYISKIADYLETLSDKEVNNFVVKNFGKHFESTREALYSKLGEKTLEKLLNCFMLF